MEHALPAETTLRPPRNRLDPRAATWWRLRAIGSSGAQLLVVWFVASTFEQLQPWSWYAVTAAAAWLVFDALAVPAWRMRVHRWEVSDEAVYAASGWWLQEWRIAPVSRIQTVDTTRGPLQRRLGLSTLEVTTASASGAVRVEGLDAELAEQLVERLTAVTHATPGDAT
jgi:uncharacterized protein